MSLFRVALLTTAVVFMLPPSQAKADDSLEMEFLGGTVKTIPANTFGALNLKDTNDLRFQYGTSVYRLPYPQITETEITEPGNKSHWLIHMPGKKHFQTLVISYRDANGAENTLNFQVNSRTVATAVEGINSRRHVAEAATADPNGFWGDKIWKTPRTLPLWQQDQKPASPALTVGAGGTK